MHLLLYALSGVPMLQTSYFSQQMCSWKVYSKAYFWTFNPFGMCGGEGGWMTLPLKGLPAAGGEVRKYPVPWCPCTFKNGIRPVHTVPFSDIFARLHQRFISACHRWSLLKEVASFIMKGIGVIRNHQNLKNLFGLYQHREIRCPVLP